MAVLKLVSDALRARDVACLAVRFKLMKWDGTMVKLILWNRGQEPTKVLGTVHGPGYSGGASIKKAILVK
jgi:hypothetical protein